MKKLLLGTVALMALGLGGTSAMAADMPVYKAEPLPVWTWAGVYFGAHAGGARGTSSYQDTIFVAPTSFATEAVEQKPGGWVVGGQAGARWQWGGWVFGIEGTLAVSDIRANDPACGNGLITGALCTRTGPAIVQPAGTILERDVRIQNLYTATAQLGYAWNRTLWYVKGGYAGGEAHQETRLVNAATALFNGVSRQANGWTVGTGIEYLVLQNLSLGIEYNYLRLGFGNTFANDGPGPIAAGGASGVFYNDWRADIHQVVARANYRLDWGILWGSPAPVAARY